MGNSLIRQHYSLATTGSIPDNGGANDVQKMNTLSRGNGYSGATRGHLKDGARSAGKPVKHTRGKFPAQSAPDHGSTY